MSEAAEATKSKTEVTAVTMTDGRVVNFAGKRKVNKETLFEGPTGVSIRMDFRNGDTRTIACPESLLLKFAGHGMEQKFGDELASPADKPLSEEDMVIAIDDLNTEIQKGNWGKGRAAGGGGVSGAHMVVQAIMEATGKDATAVKAFLQKKIDTTEGLSRRALYDSFRVAGTKTGEIIARLEAGKKAKEAKVNADDVLSEV